MARGPGRVNDSNGLVRFHDAVLALNQGAGVGPGRHVLEKDIAGERPEQGNPLPDQHRHTGDDEPIHQGAQESLDRDTAVDVQVSRAASAEVGNDVCRLAAHVFDHL